VGGARGHSCVAWVGRTRLLNCLPKRTGLPQSGPEPMIELAQILHRHSRLKEAVRHWQVVRELFPHSEEGYICGVRAPREPGRQGEADALLQRYAARRNPSSCYFPAQNRGFAVCGQGLGANRKPPGVTGGSGRRQLRASGYLADCEATDRRSSRSCSAVPR
jgi:hypothetical protein